MVKKEGKRLTAWVMALMIGLGLIFPTNAALAATPTSLDTNVSVTGVDEGGTIDGSQAVNVTVDFPVPVKGDGVTDYYQYGDTVTLLLSTSFCFDPVPGGPIDLMYQTKKLGTVTLSNNTENQAIATIVFDGDQDVFDPEQVPEGEPPYSNVSGTFQASLTYNGTHDTDGEGNKTVGILEKTYQLQLPGDTITYKVEKSAEGSAVNLDDGTITWTVKITATKDTEPDPTPIDLAGYLFEDDLNGVGEYDDGFSLTGGTLVVPDENSTKLTYTFPEGSTSPQTLTFKTKIPQDKLTNGGSITNGAGLYLDGEEVGSDDFTVTIAKPSVTKTGVTNDVSDGATYTSTGRTITWYIKVDNEGRTLNNLTITDALQSGLNFDSAQWQKLEADGTTWTDVTGVSWASEPSGNEYAIGDINYVGRLKLVTKVPDATDGSVVATTYYNQATAAWTGSGGTTGSAVTGKPGVGIGYNALSKSGTQSADDVTNHQITWTINVDMKGQDTAGFAVYDLFVPDASTSDADLAGAAEWPSGLTIGANNITRNNGQKFVEVSSKDSHLTVTSTDLTKDGNVVATLVKITDLQASGSNQAVLKSQVLDPDMIAGNNPGQKVYNYAALYKDTTFRGSANNYVNYNNKVLSKELLDRAEVGNDHTTGVIDANDRTVNAADGFHYGYKEVIFRLNVNAAGLDFKNIETNLTGGFGDVVVTDTLPAGWEFVPFSGGQNYLIYDTTGALSTGSEFPSTGSLTTSGEALDSVPGLTAEFDNTADPQTAAFTFANLNQPYVILVKARPTDATFDGYLTGANTRDESNALSLKSANWTPGKSVSQKVTVNSTVLNKTLDLSKQDQGILTWTVNYTPFGHEIGTGLEDTLPQGIDLRTDSSGQLIWEEPDGSRNINVYALTLKDDGSGEYTEGAELTPDALKAAVSYDSSARNLIFTFPDKTQAYRLTYVTDITGVPGTVTNAVNLVDADGTGTSTDQSVIVSELQGAATMGRSGYLVVQKEDMHAQLLPGAEFTLYNTNADGSQAASRAVRTTGSDGTVKFYGLAPGNYVLAETKSPDDYENPSLEYRVVVGSDLKTTVNGSGVITSSAPFVVANYKATDPVGSLTISKTVAGNAADAAKTFDFTLTLNGAAGTYTYVGDGVPGGTIASGDTVSLAHGQSITITGLPSGTAYTVTEADYSGDGYTTASTGASGNIMTNTTQAAVFTNTRNVWSPSQQTGTLTISKTVTGTGADTTKAFHFTVTFTGASGSYHYTGNGVPNGTIQSGDTISLSDGQSITITGLPAGSGYEVSEDKTIAQGYSVESTGSSGTISSSRDRTAAFTNTKLPDTTGGLTISKTITGQGADLNKKFDFTVTLTDASDAYPYTGASSGTLRSGDTVSLANGESITIIGLPEGAAYTVTEADYTGLGYTASSVGAAGVISAGTTQTASFTNKWGNVPGKPGTPENPSGNIGDGTVPQGSMNGGETTKPESGDNIGDGTIPQGSMDGGKTTMPKTGDDQTGSFAKLGLLVSSAAFAALSAADYILRKKHTGKRIQK